jgi:hypothetical protein
MKYFDFKKVAEEANIPKSKVEELCRVLRAEFPRDDMMYELHILRACMAIQEGHLTLEEALRPKRAA